MQKPPSPTMKIIFFPSCASKEVLDTAGIGARLCLGSKEV
jgi:hypothetical protein